MRELAENTEDPFEKPLTKASEEHEEEAEEEVVELNDEEATLFRDLLTVGKRSKTFEVFGHSVVLETLSVRDEMRVGLSVKEYKQTEGFARAYQSAVVASAIRSIDGESWDTPLYPNDSNAEFERRLDKVRSMYPIVVNVIYAKYNELEGEFVQLLQKLGKVNG